MLTADLVQTRRRGDVLHVVPLGDEDRARALDLAEAFLDLARAHVGCERAAVLEAFRQVPVAARHRRLADGLLKLLQDGCTFEEASALDPGPLRSELFARATAARRAAAAPTDFDRAAVLREQAAALGTTPDEIERALYADLPSAHVLRAVDVPGPRVLVAAYEAGQVQAVLLRAVKVVATVRCASPATYRALFRRLKFHRLLHQITPLDGGRGYQIEIDGPFSLFDAVTKYGLQLALAFAAVSACDEWRLEADVRWGKTRMPLRFRAAGAAGDPSGPSAPALPDDHAALLEGLAAAASPWRPAVSTALLDLPGLGLCVPDFELTHETTGATVYVEAMGYWSRDAVWKRIELAQRGLPVPVVFAVAKHLRVSEAALDDDVPAALYVYARTPSPRALLERVEQVARRMAPPALPKRKRSPAP